MSNFTDKKKDAFRIASRFIKELGLYDVWLKYLYDPKTTKTWLDKDDEHFYTDDILGCSTFTDYVNDHKLTFKTHGYFMYELLQFYLAALRDPKGICYPVKIDNEKKKITLLDY
jgi:hypothetical protein